MAKPRLDMRLVELGLCESRQQAQRLIRAGAVKVNQQVIDKPGTAIAPEAQIEVKAKSPYVSRGGEKLARALSYFPIAVRDRVCLDGGISTGGFTDCLLQAGAKRIYGVDVGYGQVAWTLRTDARVILKERTNIRHLKPEELYGDVLAAQELADKDLSSHDLASHGATLPDLGVMNVSFISLTKVLPAFWHLLRAPREIVLLIKPQFEVGRNKIGKKGVVRDTQVQAEAIAQVIGAAQRLGWRYRGLTWSPLMGPAGNIEYLLWMSEASGLAIDPMLEAGGIEPDKLVLNQLTQRARQALNTAPEEAGDRAPQR